jgi:hypothetical protein
MSTNYNDVMQNYGKAYNNAINTMIQTHMEIVNQIAKQNLGMLQSLSNAAAKQASLFQDSKNSGDLMANHLKLFEENVQEMMQASQETVALITAATMRSFGALGGSCNEMLHSCDELARTTTAGTAAGTGHAGSGGNSGKAGKEPGANPAKAEGKGASV